MKKRVILWIVIIVTIAILIPVTGMSIGQQRRLERYGDTPLLGLKQVSTSADACQEVQAVIPKAHFNWLGQTWQDAHLLWEDIQIEKMSESGWSIQAHGRAGPVAIKDAVCGLPHNEQWRLLYLPDGKTLFHHPG